MLKIPFTSADFKPPYDVRLHGSNICWCSWPRIIHAALSVGKAEMPHLFRHGRYSRFEMISRASLIYANLMEGGSGSIIRTEVNKALDPTEKSSVSYSVGMAAVKMLSDKYLHVPWLMHLDVYKKELKPKYGTETKKKPDLIGLNLSGKWVVVEAKGRTGGLSDQSLVDLFEGAKEQTKNVEMAKGQPIHLRVALAAHFTNGRLHVAWQDPAEANEDALELDISTNDLLRDYYRPFLELFSQESASDLSEVNDQRYALAPLADADLTIGINTRILRALREERYADVQRIARGLSEIESEDDALAPSLDAANQTDFAGNDGILIQVGKSWSRGLMSREPEEREHWSH